MSRLFVPQGRDDSSGIAEGLTQNQTSPAALIGCLKRCRRGRNRICSFSRAAVTIAQLLKGGEADRGWSCVAVRFGCHSERRGVTSVGGQLAPFQHPTFPRASNPQVVQNDELSGHFNKPLRTIPSLSNGKFSFGSAASACEPSHLAIARNISLEKRDVSLVEVLNSHD
jgi:hypothetical protein